MRIKTRSKNGQIDKFVFRTGGAHEHYWYDSKTGKMGFHGENTSSETKKFAGKRFYSLKGVTPESYKTIRKGERVNNMGMHRVRSRTCESGTRWKSDTAPFDADVSRSGSGDAIDEGVHAGLVDSISGCEARMDEQFTKKQNKLQERARIESSALKPEQKAALLAQIDAEIAEIEQEFEHIREEADGYIAEDADNLQQQLAKIEDQRGALSEIQSLEAQYGDGGAVAALEGCIEANQAEVQQMLSELAERRSAVQGKHI